MTHIMQGEQGASIIKYPPYDSTLDITKERLREAVDQQIALGVKLTLRGYLSKKWNLARSRNDSSDKTSIGQNGGKWASTAIMQLWSATDCSWKARNDELHRRRHDDIAQSSQNEWI